MRLDRKDIGFNFSELMMMFAELSPVLDSKFLYEFFKKGNVIRLKKNDIIYEEGSSDKYVHLILKGYVRTFKDYNKGDTKTIYIFEKNQIILNIKATILNQTSIFGVQCITDCIVFRMNYDDFEEKMLSSPKTSKVLVDYILKYLLYVFQHTDQITLLTKEERYKWLENNRREILRDLPDKHIAAFLGISMASLSRIKKKYCEK
ncbi:hypothetical protein UJ101_02588 [Flavobacteriaceae bacterium UJ101]|nr:hypothetical protein UJ101_02588 [Flavobacteriaceae bacterium UJ101]